MFNFVTLIASEEAKPSGFAALGFDFKAFLIQLITFLLVFYILKKYVFGRVVDMLETRRKTIEDGVKLSAEIKSEREKLESNIADAHKEAREEANKLMAKTRDQADSVIREAEESAQTKVDKMIVEAKNKIEEETQKARRALEAETVGLVIRATEAVSREKLDDKKDATLIKDALEGRI